MYKIRLVDKDKIILAFIACLRRCIVYELFL